VVTTARTRGGYTPGELTVHTSPAAISQVTRALKSAGRRIALVPTMGALHEGHRELIRHARLMPGAGVVAVSIFVNPLQFGPTEDLARYPRPLEADLQICRDEGVELVFAPGVDDMYPAGATTTTVDPGPLGGELEGSVRPGHFAGVLTVVAKLFHIVAPDVAFFGEKDYQQLVLVRKMVRDLDFPLAVVGVPTVREPDGLALSSRNAYLSDDERARAARLPRTLERAAAEIADGVRVAEALEHASHALYDAGFGVVDYVALVDDATLEPVSEGGEGTRLIAAATIGKTRLIDNLPLGDGKQG
jgi:pantoate--beta-alanine ligase